LAINGMPASCSGTGLFVSQAYAGGLANETDVFTNSITVKADANFLDCLLHNTGPDPIDAQLFQLVSGNFVTWTALAPGSSQMLSLAVAQINSDYFMTVGGTLQPNTDPLAWDMTMTPHL
jgi:hypothetical protein